MDSCSFEQYYVSYSYISILWNDDGGVFLEDSYKKLCVDYTGNVVKAVCPQLDIFDLIEQPTVFIGIVFTALIIDAT